MPKCKCPFFTRRIGAYDWKGIKCTSDNWQQGLTLGHKFVNAWSLEKRENHIETYCNGDYKSCWQYKNHIGGEHIEN